MFDLQEFEHFDSYSSFKKRCLSISKQEKLLETVIEECIKQDKDNDISKLNVLWDTGTIAQNIIMKKSGIKQVNHELLFI